MTDTNQRPARSGPAAADPTSSENLDKEFEQEDITQQESPAATTENDSKGLDGGGQSEPVKEDPGAEKEDRKPRQELDDKDSGGDPRESETRDDQLSMAERRAKRIPMGRHQKLEAIAAPYQRPDLYHRFALDKPGRIEQHLAAGYEFELDNNGKHLTYPSGENHLHLMKLPIEFRTDDLKAREADISNRIAQEVKLESDEYSPDGQKTSLTASGTFTPDS